ncbi:MAG: response regulator [Proteobacteria bacterium]|nr:response regulator [Pseudomonadota bacterium]NIS69824.1 response regulator [Pseudomonadota bacterium]
MKDMIRAELIDIHEVTRIFGLSIEAVRKYKALGLIEPIKRDGRKDLYNEEEIFRTKNLIKSYKQEGKSLREIEKIVRKLREIEYSEEQFAGSGNTKKILIIEDDDLLVNLLEEQLTARFPENELRIYNAKDGLTGIERARRIKPDLIILDLVLPNIEGKKVHQILTRERNTCNLKFLILSGCLIYEPQNAKFIKKPFDMDELLDNVEILIGLHTEKTESV